MTPKVGMAPAMPANGFVSMEIPYSCTCGYERFMIPIMVVWKILEAGRVFLTLTQRYIFCPA